MNQIQKKRKKKLLNKYITQDQSKNINNRVDNQDRNIWMRDDDDIIQPSSSSSQEISQQVKKRARLASSDQEPHQQDEKYQKEKKLQKQKKKERKLKKKLGKALGIQKDGDLQQFLSNLQVQGIQKQQILQYLKNNKTVTIKKSDQHSEVKAEDTKNKKKKKKGKKQQQSQGAAKKFAMFQKSESSDIQIPEQARMKTIYRNKDGTIKQFSEKEQKQKRRKEIMQRLAEWQKGMKKQKSDDEGQEHQDLQLAKNNKIWNDPMKRWEQKVQAKFLSCRFEGPPNRYNIRPGFRWDGVVRGNGFENRLLQQANLKKAEKDKQHMEYMRNL